MPAGAGPERRKHGIQLENLRALATDTANHLRETSGSGRAGRDRTGRIMAEIDNRERDLATAKEEAR